MESGTPGFKATHDGWMNRALPKGTGKVSPVRAVALGPRCRGPCAGCNPAVSLQSIDAFQVRNPEASRSWRRCTPTPRTR